MTYRSIHNWITYNFGKADRCEKCKCPRNTKQRQYAWSNKSGNYIKDRKDWWRLCYSCHKKYDIKRGNLVIWNKGMRKERPTMICEWCNKPFLQKRKAQILCGTKCTAYRNGNIKKVNLLTRE